MPLFAMNSIEHDDAVADLKKYFEIRENGRPRYSGSQFESFAGGGDLREPNKITAEDLIAVSMLSVHVPGQAALGILGTYAEQLGEQLAQIPVGLRFEELTEGEFQKFLADGSPADKLWEILRQPGNRWGIGQTTASKILARKRPHLIPIFDSVIAKRVKIPGSGTQWTRWWDAFHQDPAEDVKLVEKLKSIREDAGQTHLSLLRVLDIVLWTSGGRQGIVPDATLDEA
ncbi:DUF6308 family protein [Arthrobacter sp. MYb216]|uniref:DUF6308 family protein n=2 Tax=Arthrobacter TaxID=1663 RepID=UPI0015E3DA60|nr:DUF6308 family protein [Arthrobacter sp. MYb216]